jgi:plastocyanin
MNKFKINMTGFLSMPLALGLAGVGILLIIVGTFLVLNKRAASPTSSQVHQIKQETIVDQKTLLPPGTTNLSELEIIITKDGFTPSTILISKGQQIQWINKDTSTHQIVSDASLPALNNTDPLPSGQSFSYTFDSQGTFTFRDELNPNILPGKVIVR